MSTEYGREPCPDRILDDLGGAFSMGAIGGSVYYFFSGLKNSPRGERLLGGLQTVQLNAPKTGGGFAVWGGLFSTFDCSLVYLRQKEDPWNSISAGFLTGGFLHLRSGPRTALSSAMFGGVLLAMIEGSGILLNRMMSANPNQEELASRNAVPGSPNYGYAANPAMMGNAPQTSTSMPSDESSSSESFSFSNLFPFLKSEEPEKKETSEKLVDFDSNPPPLPDFASSSKENSWFK